MRLTFASWSLALLLQTPVSTAATVDLIAKRASETGRERIRLNTDWKFWHSATIPDGVVYDLRPDANSTDLYPLKEWILPLANDFIQDASLHREAPAHSPTVTPKYVAKDFNDDDWDVVKVPHDWAIQGPFYTEDNPPVSGEMAKLPVQGVGWYRRQLEVSQNDLKKSIFLDVDGAMSYPIVWLNGHLVGGWPYGYNSFRLDLTPFLEEGKENQLAIRVENPTSDFSRWYSGAGIYRNVWLTKVNPIHVANWGTFVTTSDVSEKGATVDIIIEVENDSNSTKDITVASEIYSYDATSQKRGQSVASFKKETLTVSGNKKGSVNGSTTVTSPLLWGPPPEQTPNLYVTVTRLYSGKDLLDTYETVFGIRSLKFDPDYGLFVNGKHVYIQGANQHHDLGALGAAFNTRAAVRQLDELKELGVNAIRMAHNPPAPELLELTDRMGFLVLDEIFDCWEVGKKTTDFHLIFPDWSEPDLRAFIRRDRNHPSVIIWSYGNEVAEQQSSDVNATRIGTRLHKIVGEEDATRPSTTSMNRASPNMTFPGVADLIGLNYQGEGVRYGEAYAHLIGNRTEPRYPGFHEAFPDKLVFGTEVAWSLSSRGSYLFPVTNYTSAPVNDTSGGDSKALEISAYELYSADAGSSPDRVFATQDRYPFVAGGFVWAGWDYLGEPYPYDARSSYSGIIDLAGFKKDRYYLYQSRWRPDVKVAHIVPHWTWPDRKGKVTPVHVFSAADEAELFVNGESQGKLERADSSYRFRWDDVVYQPGEVRVVTYKDGKEWAVNSVKTVGEAAGLRLSADSKSIASDGDDLGFISVEVVDSEGNFVPEANNTISFSVTGPGRIVATDNGYEADYTAFGSTERKVFHGLALAIVQAEDGKSGSISIVAESEGLESAKVSLEIKRSHKHRK